MKGSSKLLFEMSLTNNLYGTTDTVKFGFIFDCADDNDCHARLHGYESEPMLQELLLEDFY